MYPEASPSSGFFLKKSHVEYSSPKHGDPGSALNVVPEMKDRLYAGCAGQQRMLLMPPERRVVLRHIHCQAEIFLVAWRQRSRDWMPKRPAQSERSFVRVGCR